MSINVKKQFTEEVATLLTEIQRNQEQLFFSVNRLIDLSQLDALKKELEGLK